MLRKEINIFTDERKIITDDGDEIYVLFDLEENGDYYLILTDGEALFFVKENDGKITEVNDEGEIDILVNLLFEFSKDNLILDKDQKGDLLAKLMGEDSEKSV
ncbi:hypothetical protein HGG64_02680 [Mycoplasma phocoeninasale]|uniref:DUF1292 domain-containing protein n=1 Tax=Mycoplasma phocoeninasale TaxID=2726117 RepID=A0A858U5S7_9MOLU|nr:hypothetical protein [Mycoplasma phocoeninasale]QJG66593.1 hypothetical protein HGG64_02680 [Mycoplasma phocoeninasale]